MPGIVADVLGEARMRPVLADGPHPVANGASPRCPRTTLNPTLGAHLVGIFVHSDQVALHGAAGILQHSAKLLALVQNKKVDVQFRWSSPVVGNLSGAVWVHGGLSFIEGGHNEATKTLCSLAGEKSIGIAGTGPEQRERRQRLPGAGGHEALAGSPITGVGSSDAAFVLAKGRTHQQRAYENQEPAASFHIDLLNRFFLEMRRSQLIFSAAPVVPEFYAPLQRKRQFWPAEISLSFM